MMVRWHFLYVFGTISLGIVTHFHCMVVKMGTHPLLTPFHLTSVAIAAFCACSYNTRHWTHDKGHLKYDM